MYKPKCASLHGGVAFYINQSLDYTILPIAVDDNLCDSLFIELKLKSLSNQQTKVILGNIYRPPHNSVQNHNSFIEALESTLDGLSNNAILVGDFNYDLLKIKENIHINNFFDTLLSNGFIPKITLPTRITHQSKTLIDNCFVRLLHGSQTTISKVLLSNISDHQPYLVSFNYLLNSESIQQYIRLQTWSAQAVVNLKHTLKDIFSTNEFLQSSIIQDPNERYNLFHNLLHSAITQHLPTKLVKLHKYKHKKTSWISQGIIRSIKFRDKLYRRLKETPVSDQIHQTLKINLQTYNRILKCSIRKAKKDYYHSRFVKCKNDIKKKPGHASKMS